MVYIKLINKKLILFYSILLILNIKSANALISNAKVKQLIDQEVNKKVQEQ